MSEIVNFGTVAIVGVGLLGGSIGKALSRPGSADRIIGVGRTPQKLELARSLGAVSEFTTDLADVAAKCDFIILCTPVGQIIRELQGVLRLASPTCTVTDVGSIKSAICAAAEGDTRFVGGHPMAGSEQTGVIAARPDLFADATWAITPSETTDPGHFNKLKSLAQQLGASTIILSPVQHDRAVALTSHLPHAVATSLMRLAAARNEISPEIQSLTAGSFADATRVAASSPVLWADIFEHNREAIIEALTDYRNELDGFLGDLIEGNNNALQERFAAGSDAKNSWSKQM
jgi:prephenate dehydrogenase